MKEAQAIIYEWLRSIGYTATQREVKKLADTFKHHGYCKPLDSPELREKIARIICCFAKDNKSCTECKENIPPNLVFPDCFSDKGGKKMTQQINGMVRERLINCNTHFDFDQIEAIMKVVEDSGYSDMYEALLSALGVMATLDQAKGWVIEITGVIKRALSKT